MRLHSYKNQNCLSQGFKAAIWTGSPRFREAL